MVSPALPSLPKKPTRAALQQLLRERDAQLLALNTRLTALQTPLPLATGTQPDYLRQLQHLFAGVVVADPQGRITWANANFLARWECTLADLVGRLISELPYSRQPDPETLAALQASLVRQEPFQFEMPDPSPAHHKDWLRIKVRPIRNAAQEVEVFVGLLEDITPQKKAHLAVERSEKRFRELAENVPGVLYRWRQLADGSMRSIYCSPQILEIFGISVNVSQDFGSFIHPADQVAWYASIAEAAKTFSPWYFEGRVLVPGQPLRWCRGNSALSYRDTESIIYSGIIQDITPLRQAEETARHSTLRRLLAIDGLGDGSWESNLQTGITIISPEYKAMLGYADAECPDECTHWSQYVHPDDVPTLEKAWITSQRGTTGYFTAEHRLRCQDGSYKWVLSRGLIATFDEGGQPLLFTGLNVDISAHKKTQDDLAVTALRLATTIAMLRRGILLVDENHKVVLTNEAFCLMFGFSESPEQLIGTDYAVVEAQMQRGLLGPVSETLSLEHLPACPEEVRHEMLSLRDGRVLEYDFAPVRHGATDIGYLWKFKDITTSYNAEMSLRMREEKYRTIIDNMQLGLVEMDLEKRILYVNPSFCRTTGYSNEELFGNFLPASILAPYNQVLLDEHIALRPQGISSSYELPILTKTGETKWLLTGAGPFYDQHRAVTGSIGIIFDITQQKELEQNLREAKQLAEDSTRAKELFLANMSHEIRTPMNAILGMSQLLAKTPLAARQSNYLHAITTSAQNLLVIINDILDLSKLDAGQMTIERVGFNVPRLCAQVEKTLLYKAEEKGLSLVVKLSPLIPDVVLGDPYRLTQILLNLAGNAVKFTSKGEVTIECDVAGYYDDAVMLAFVVRDTGIGIDPVYLKQIFQEFSQEDTSITRQFGGTGLGLSISRSLAQLMKSEILVESEKNQGTTIHFTLALPVGTLLDLPQRRAVADVNVQELRGKRVLLVEDNEYNRLLAKTILVNAHMKVTEAENGRVAVEYARRQPFDLILMDVQMPVMDGFEATQYLRRELGVATPIIALTASAISGEQQRCLAAGMDDYLAKPFYEDELMQLVCDWVLKPAPAPAAAVPLPAPALRLYALDVLLTMGRGDDKFVSSMLQTFINGTQNALRDLHTALAVGNLVGLHAATHQLRPSLHHLQIRPALELLEALDAWNRPFSFDELQPLVEAIDRVLRLVIGEMSAELELRRTSGR